eukprot:3794066-Pyramimonas_sp.AAC.1
MKLGPDVVHQMWTEPLEQYSSRAAGIARARPPPVVAAKLYNQRSVSTLGYVSQFALLPPHIPQKEHAVLA